jgi:hypothetical protein
VKHTNALSTRQSKSKKIRLRKVTLDCRCKRLRFPLSRPKIADRLPSGALMPIAFRDTMPVNGANAPPQRMMGTKSSNPARSAKTTWTNLALRGRLALRDGTLPLPLYHRPRLLISTDSNQSSHLNTSQIATYRANP